jgi:hypothetical protein
MPVLIKRHSRRFMAMLRLHRLDVGPRRDHQRGRSVPQLMDSHPRELLVCGLAPLDRNNTMSECLDSLANADTCAAVR